MQEERALSLTPCVDHIGQCLNSNAYPSDFYNYIRYPSQHIYGCSARSYREISCPIKWRFSKNLWYGRQEYCVFSFSDSNNEAIFNHIVVSGVWSLNDKPPTLHRRTLLVAFAHKMFVRAQPNLSCTCQNRDLRNARAMLNPRVIEGVIGTLKTCQIISPDGMTRPWVALVYGGSSVEC